MARERIRLLFNPYPQLFYRALLAALVGHALVLAAMGLYASGAVFQAEPPVVATPVSLVLTAPAAQAVIKPSACRPTVNAEALGGAASQAIQACGVTSACEESREARARAGCRDQSNAGGPRVSGAAHAVLGTGSSRFSDVSYTC